MTKVPGNSRSQLAWAAKEPWPESSQATLASRDWLEPRPILKERPVGWPRKRPRAISEPPLLVALFLAVALAGAAARRLPARQRRTTQARFRFTIAFLRR